MNSPAENFSQTVQQLLTHEPGPAWAPDRFDELELELGRFVDATERSAKETIFQADYSRDLCLSMAAFHRRACRAHWLLSVVRQLRGSELAFILTELYTPQQLAYVMGRVSGHPEAHATVVLSTMLHESPEVTR